MALTNGMLCVARNRSTAMLGLDTHTHTRTQINISQYRVSIPKILERSVLFWTTHADALQLMLFYFFLVCVCRPGIYWLYFVTCKSLIKLLTAFLFSLTNTMKCTKPVTNVQSHKNAQLPIAPKMLN